MRTEWDYGEGTAVKFSEAIKMTSRVVMPDDCAGTDIYNIL